MDTTYQSQDTTTQKSAILQWMQSLEEESLWNVHLKEVEI